MAREANAAEKPSTQNKIDCCIRLGILVLLLAALHGGAALKCLNLLKISNLINDKYSSYPPRYPFQDLRSSQIFRGST